MTTLIMKRLIAFALLTSMLVLCEATSHPQQPYEKTQWYELNNDEFSITMPGQPKHEDLSIYPMYDGYSANADGINYLLLLRDTKHTSSPVTLLRPPQATERNVVANKRSAFFVYTISLSITKAMMPIIHG